jgi:hypothetical protein
LNFTTKHSGTITAASKRNYAQEYERRIAHGLALGRSRQTARGRHPAEGATMPDGRRHIPISSEELNKKQLRADTVEDLHRVNVGLRGTNADKWETFVRGRGWALNTSKNGYFYTQNDIPSEIIERMSNGERRYFFGY